MKNKFQKNNLYNSLGDAFEKFEDAPPERVWSAIEFDLAKKQLDKDKKRFFWIQFSSILIIVFFMSFGVYELMNYNGSKISENKSRNKQTFKAFEVEEIDNQTDSSSQTNESNQLNNNHSKHVVRAAELDARKNDAERTKTNTTVVNAKDIAHSKTSKTTDYKANPTTSTLKTNQYSGKKTPEIKYTLKKTQTTSKQIPDVNTNVFSNKNKMEKSDIKSSLVTQKPVDSILQADNLNTNSKDKNTDSLVLPFAKNIIDSIFKQTPDSSIAIVNNIKQDTNSNQNSIPIPTEKNKTLSRLSVMAFFSPDYSSRITTNNSGITGPKSSEINKTESPLFAFTSGFKIGYDLSDRWNIQVGAMYSYIEQKSIPLNIQADTSNITDIHYSFTTSSGAVSFSSDDFGEDDAKGLTNKKVYLAYSAKEKIEFINVPVMIRYKLINRNINVYVFGGFMANFIVNHQVKLTVLNEPADLTANTNKILGLQKMNAGFLFGIEFQYNIFKGLNVLLAPTIRGSMTSINKNTSVKSYPYSIGLATGLCYHF